MGYVTVVPLSVPNQLAVVVHVCIACLGILLTITPSKVFVYLYTLAVSPSWGVADKIYNFN